MFDYEDIAFHWVNRLSFLIRKELATRFLAAGYDISAEEWAILLVLWKKGPQHPGMLADVTIKDRTTVTRLVDTMARKGLVIRHEDTADRRRSVISASPLGASLQSKLVPIAQTLIAEASCDIPAEDIAKTTQTLRAMTGKLHDRRRKTGKPEKEL
jgi:DNA-binding MarR family transcriptional regulator